MKLLAFSGCVFFLAARAAAEINLTVAADGSAPFRSVQAAISNAPNGSVTSPVIIHIKPGTYKELIYAQREKRFVRLVGEDARTTTLTFDLFARQPGPDGKPIGTFRTPSTQIDADDFTAENITFENSAGPKGQALALRVDGDRVTFRHCRFLGWQDTILDNRGRHYYEDCEIAGHVDFIFGGGTAWFEKCRLTCLGDGYITAASTPEAEACGFVFDHCTISGDKPETRTYLGRPWRPYAAVTYLHCAMTTVIRPEGWNNWRDPAREKTARFAEFDSSGEGGDMSHRVGWARTLTAAEAANCTVTRVLGGWQP
ncbi:MAG TPA: pectinesterase family protein [Verrucomicrobiae bacterium]|jgi:pectinesterase|nr:pectinesterase family protein [Verrucomicrobiae bacterium]